MRRHLAIYLQFVLFLATHDPSFALRLWVYQKRIPCCLGDDDTVLNGQLIAWESIKIPFTNLKKDKSKNWFTSKIWPRTSFTWNRSILSPFHTELWTAKGLNFRTDLFVRCVACPRGGGGGYFLTYTIYVCVFWAFLVWKRVFLLCPFLSGSGCGFRGNYGSVWMYLLFQFQMKKNEMEICEFEMHLKRFFVCALIQVIMT